MLHGEVLVTMEITNFKCHLYMKPYRDINLSPVHSTTHWECGDWPISVLPLPPSSLWSIYTDSRPPFRCVQNEPFQFTPGPTNLWYTRCLCLGLHWLNSGSVWFYMSPPPPKLTSGVVYIASMPPPTHNWCGVYILNVSSNSPRFSSGAASLNILSFDMVPMSTKLISLLELSCSNSFS